MKTTKNLAIAAFASVAKEYGTKVTIVACDSLTGFYAFCMRPDLRTYVTSRKYSSERRLAERLAALVVKVGG